MMKAQSREWSHLPCQWQAGSRVSKGRVRWSWYLRADKTMLTCGCPLPQKCVSNITVSQENWCSHWQVWFRPHAATSCLRIYCCNWLCQNIVSKPPIQEMLDWSVGEMGHILVLQSITSEYFNHPIHHLQLHHLDHGLQVRARHCEIYCPLCCLSTKLQSEHLQQNYIWSPSQCQFLPRKI